MVPQPFPGSPRAWLALATAAVAGTWAVSATTGAAPGASPVSFLERGSLKIDLVRVRADEGLRVTLHNDSGCRQKVRLGVVGLDAPGAPRDAQAARMFPTPQHAMPVDAPKPGQSETVTIPLSLKADVSPTAGVYSGTIAAMAERGPPVRRVLELTVADAKPDTIPQGARLGPENPPDITLPATNFIPSPLDPTGPLLVALALVALAALAIFRDWMSRHQLVRVTLLLAAPALLIAAVFLGTFGSDESGPLLVVLAVIAGTTTVGLWNSRRHRTKLRGALILLTLVLLLSAATCGEFGPDLSDQPGTSAVATKPVPVTESARTGTVGVVLNGNGDIASLEVAGSEQRDLDVEGLHRAGVYSGQYDLTTAEGGAAKATVNVRDWWPWAFAAILLGVVVGYRLRRYFLHDRPQGKVRVDANRFRRQQSERHQRFAATPAGHAFPGWSIMERVRTRLAEIDRQRREDPTAAAAALDVLRTYAQAFDDLRVRLGDLYRLAGLLEDDRAGSELNLAAPHVAALESYRELTEDTFDGGDFDLESKRLTSAQERVEAALDLTVAVRRRLRAITGNIKRGKALLDLHPADAKTIQEAIDKLQELGRQELQAPDPKALEDIAKAEAAPVKTITDIGARPSKGVQLSGEERVAGRIQIEELSAEETLRGNASIVCETSDAAGCSGNVDDLFLFRLQIQGGRLREDIALEWSFGDDTDAESQTLRSGMTDADAPAVSHRYVKAGDYNVEVRKAGADGPPLATQKATVTGPSRAEASDAQLDASDRAMSLLAGFLAVGSGMLTLYLAKEAWGVPKDYVEALLWGGVVSEGVALVTALVTDRFGSAAKAA